MSGARNTDPNTSHAAFGSLDVTYLEGRVLAAIQEFEDGRLLMRSFRLFPTLIGKPSPHDSNRCLAKV